MQNSQIGVHQKISEVDEQPGDNVRISIENLLKQLPPVNAQHNISRVPKQLRKMNPSAYDPQLISIGPFHNRGRKDLEFTEQYKLQGLMNFLHRMNAKLESSEEDSLKIESSEEDDLKIESLEEDDLKIESSEEDILKTESLKVLVEKAHTWVKEARNCYGEPINMNDDDFVKMMLVDGCFLVEIIILVHGPHGSRGFPPIQTNVDFSFNVVRILEMGVDLTKLENQLPFFVLNNLFNLVPKHDKSISFKILTYKFFRPMWLQDYELSNEILSKKLPKHFVDLLSFYFDPNMPPDIQKKHDENSKEKNNFLRFFHLPLHPHRQKLSQKTGNEMNKSSTFSCFLSSCHRQKKHKGNKKENKFIPLSITELREAGVTINKGNKKENKFTPLSITELREAGVTINKDNKKENKFIPLSITELREAGVTIKKAENAKSVMNISFKNGVLEIPPLIIDDSFETIMRNLIAYEQVYRDTTHVTQYVVFMDYLISTKKDVNLLVKAGILINDIGGSDKEVSEMFNNLCKSIMLSNLDYYCNINNALHEHYNGCWNKSKASLKHNYFNTPWAVVSFLAATFLIVLTLLQTIFSGISTF